MAFAINAPDQKMVDLFGVSLNQTASMKPGAIQFAGSEANAL
jgi:hypothetical protein